MEASQPGQGETILIVEDDPHVRLVLLNGLKELGYLPLEAGNEQQALNLLRAGRHSVSLVLSDLVMPEMGGLELPTALQQDWPDIKLPLLSGYPLREPQSKLRDHPTIASWLQKPVDLAELGAQIARLLERQ